MGNIEINKNCGISNREKVVLGALLATNTLDLVSTIVGIGMGIPEINPGPQHMGKMETAQIVKCSFVASLAYISYKTNRGHLRWPEIGPITIMGINIQNEPIKWPKFFERTNIFFSCTVGAVVVNNITSILNQ